MQRPDASEYAEYYGRYVDRVPRGDVAEILADQLAGTLDLFAGVDEARAAQRYEPGKWSVKQVLGHMIDTERAFGFRALAFARGERAPIPGMEQDDYVAAAKLDARPLANLLAEYEGLRRADIALFWSFDEEESLRRGTASEVEFSVRSIPFIIAGHELHHSAVLRERYGLG